MQELTTFISNHPQLSTALAIIVFLLLIVELLRAKQNSFQINPAQATHLINRDHANVIDIRPREIFKTGHIIDAQCLSPADILNTPKKLEKLKSRPLIIVGNSGQESQKIAAQLLKQGYNAYSLAGGIRAWTNAQMPLIKESS